MYMKQIIALRSESTKSHNKKTSFSFDLKLETLYMVRISEGRLFHNCGSANMNEWSARVILDLM